MWIQGFRFESAFDSMTTRILHAGLHKTGSTYLQRSVFPRMEGIIYIHQHDFGRGPLIPNGSDKPILFSSEAACGYPYPETPEFSPDRLLTNCTLLGIDKVLLVKRDFHEWVLSLYFQTLNEGRTWRIEEFVEVNRAALETWEFATERVKSTLDERKIDTLVISQQALRADHDATVCQICKFMGCPPICTKPVASNSARYGTLTISTYRLLNRTYLNIFCRAIFRTLAKTPRKLIQRGHLGALTERLSRSRLSPEDVKVLFA